MLVMCLGIPAKTSFISWAVIKAWHYAKQLKNGVGYGVEIRC